MYVTLHCLCIVNFQEDLTSCLCHKFCRYIKVTRKKNKTPENPNNINQAHTSKAKATTDMKCMHSDTMEWVLKYI